MFSYLALGDSITVGVGAPTGKGYVELLAQKLQNYYFVMKKVCRKGINCKDLHKTLKNRNHFRNLISNASFITLYIGGNDLNLAYLKYLFLGKNCVFHEAIQDFMTQYQNFLYWLRSNSHAIILTATVYNPFPNESIARQIIPTLNRSIVLSSNKLSIPVVDIYSSFRGKEKDYIFGYQDGQFNRLIPFLQRNPVHPNERGHQIIAQSFWSKLVSLKLV